MPAEDQRFLVPCGPSTDQAANGPESGEVLRQRPGPPKVLAASEPTAWIGMLFLCPKVVP
jgi:hypothetical protein